ncbi:MAG: hypothetical protein RJA67_238 [Bacteroidota bacterium]|jgi:hypothetical protein
MYRIEFRLLKSNLMKTLLITLLLLTIIIANTLTIMDINKRNQMTKQVKLNLSFIVFYLPLLGPILYYAVWKNKYSK